MCKNLKTIVYLTVNLVNHKIYVGVHNTETPDRFDGYIGNSIYGPTCKHIQNPSTPFHYAVKKYGYKNFRRYTLKVCDTREEALELEKLIVNEKFISSKNTYNVEIGGGDPPHKLKPVYFYDLEGNYLKEYPSLKDAAKDFNIKYTTIGRIIKEKKAWRQFFISFEKVDKLDITLYRLSRYKHQIDCYDLDNNYIKSYNSYAQAAKDLNLSITGITYSIQHNKPISNYILKHKNNLTKYTNDFSVNNAPKQLNMYDKNWNYVKSYHCYREAEQELNTSLNNINSYASRGTLFKGYFWTIGDVIENPYFNDNGRQVGKYDLEGNLLKIYKSVCQAKKEYPNCVKVLKGYMNKCKGFVFKYIDE